jgi:hypothetical protein
LSLRRYPLPALQHFSSRSPIKIDVDAPPLTSEEGDEIFQIPGYVTLSAAGGANPSADKLAFGIEVTMPQNGRPVIVRHCLGAEGVNFRLYYSMADKKPYATYYFALGYDTDFSGSSKVKDVVCTL